MTRTTSRPSRRPSRLIESVVQGGPSSIAAQRRQLYREGYLVIRNLIPPDQLPQLRAAAESMVEVTRAQAAAARKAGDPPGGWWDANPQPRVNFGPSWEDPRGTPLVEFFLGDSTFEFTRHMLGSPDADCLGMILACNAQLRDFGPADWHRDIHPHDMAPLDGLQLDLKHNNPWYLQWNIPLYDDNVFWVIPRSHGRRNTPEETRLGKANPRQALPGGIPVDLKAGDGVIYINLIIHWGSNYSTRLRRTLHGGYRQFGGKIALNHIGGYPPRGDYAARLQPRSRERVRRADQLWARERDQLAATLRAVLLRDAKSFRAHLAAMHPGRVGRMVQVVILSKLAIELLRIKRAGTDGPLRDNNHNEDLAHRFTLAELETLVQRFAGLDRLLRTEEDQFEPLFQSGPMKYNFYAMPEGFGLGDFIASWG